MFQGGQREIDREIAKVWQKIHSSNSVSCRKWIVSFAKKVSRWSERNREMAKVWQKKLHTERDLPHTLTALASFLGLGIINLTRDPCSQKYISKSAKRDKEMAKYKFDKSW